MVIANFPAIVSVKLPDADAPQISCATAEKVKVPAWVGVPEMTPLANSATPCGKSLGDGPDERRAAALNAQLGYIRDANRSARQSSRRDKRGCRAYSHAKRENVGLRIDLSLSLPQQGT